MRVVPASRIAPTQLRKWLITPAAVLDASGVRRAGVVGLSIGGMIAQELALRHPDRVHRLVLGYTHCGGRMRIPPNPHVIQQLTHNAGLTHEEMVEKNLTLLVTPQFLRSGSGT